MSAERNENHPNLHLVEEPGYTDVLKRLIASLESCHHRDAELHQLYLETQWLLSNQRSGALVLPTKWQLIVFRMVQNQKLQMLPGAYEAATHLVLFIKSVTARTERVS